MDIAKVLEEADGSLENYRANLEAMRETLAQLDALHSRLQALQENISVTIPHGEGSHLRLALVMGQGWEKPMLSTDDVSYDAEDGTDYANIDKLCKSEGSRSAMIAVYRALPEICAAFKKKCQARADELNNIRAMVSKNLQGQ